ncbi:hypothetical protein CTI12_AA207960 [Artemisia annua]|uniref:Uncharacterized protein n=1 Tax=Artemisia annua TaxID=35608 RepID=A0A2U1MFM4_ARTAN|nr:hypothetical protein CTI12_AA207960 [Artemisia annua]
MVEEFNYYYYFSLASLVVVVSGLSSDGQTLLSLSTHWVTSSSPSLLSSWNASHTNLGQFAVVGSGLTGKIPPEIGNCTSLSDLQLDTNQLEGRIPSEFGMLNLTNLSLSTNRLTGKVPMSIWKIKSLEYLLLYENSLAGELPVEDSTQLN